MTDEPRVSDALPPNTLADEIKPPVEEKKEPVAAPDASKPKEPEEDSEGEDDDKPGVAADEAGTGEDKPRTQRPGKYRRQIMRQEAQIEALTTTVRELTHAIARPTAVNTQKGDGDAELKPPKEADFEDHDEYIRALTRWEVRQETAKLLKDSETKQTTRERETLESHRIEAARARLEKGREKYADFEEFAFADDVPISESMMNVMEDSDHFADIAYYLGKHPDDAFRISRLSPAAAAREIGRIEGQFLKPAKPKTTSAPDPVKTVKPGNEPRKDPSKMTPKEYRAWREGGSK